MMMSDYADENEVRAQVWTPQPQGIIFDFDGLMVNTEKAIYGSWKRLFEREGEELPLSVFNQCLGSGYTHWNPERHLEERTGKVYDWDAINARRQREIEEELSEEGLLPGVSDLMSFCDERGLPMAVASSSSRRWVQGWLEALGLYDRFRVVVCRTDGYPVKPAPDLFLAAAEGMALEPACCLVFEDSRNGVVAACAAGMKVVAVPNEITAPAMPFPGACLHVENLLKVIPYGS